MPLDSGGARGHTKWMAWLFLRASPSKQRFAVLHTGSKPARTPLPVPIRPRDPRVVCTAVVEKEMATSACAPVRVRLEPRDPDSRIDLVSRSSIDDMFKVFSESDVLTWSNFPSHPLSVPSSELLKVLDLDIDGTAASKPLRCTGSVDA